MAGNFYITGPVTGNTTTFYGGPGSSSGNYVNLKYTPSFTGVNGQRFLSRPMKVHFAGWESDTHTLQQHGWQLSAHEDMEKMQFMVALQHEKFLMKGVSQRVDHDYYHNVPDGYEPILDFTMGSNIVQHMHGGMDISRMQPIDAAPQILDKINSMEDLRLFAPAMHKTQDIIVPEYDVDDLLSMILEKQQASREKIIMDKVRDEGYEQIISPQRKIHAQIISLADYQKAA